MTTGGMTEEKLNRCDTQSIRARGAHKEMNAGTSTGIKYLGCTPATEVSPTGV